MIYYHLLLLTTGEYTILDRRISRFSKPCRTMPELLQSLQFFSYSNLPIKNIQNPTVLFKSPYLKDFQNLDRTHPEYFI